MFFSISRMFVNALMDIILRSLIINGYTLSFTILNVSFVAGKYSLWGIAWVRGMCEVWCISNHYYMALAQGLHTMHTSKIIYNLQVQGSKY